jgi:hypothetical protein
VWRGRSLSFEYGGFEYGVLGMHCVAYSGLLYQNSHFFILICVLALHLLDLGVDAKIDSHYHCTDPSPDVYINPPSPLSLSSSSHILPQLQNLNTKGIWCGSPSASLPS